METFLSGFLVGTAAYMAMMDDEEERAANNDVEEDDIKLYCPPNPEDMTPID